MLWPLQWKLTVHAWLCMVKISLQKIRETEPSRRSLAKLSSVQVYRNRQNADHDKVPPGISEFQLISEFLNKNGYMQGCIDPRVFRMVQKKLKGRDVIWLPATNPYIIFRPLPIISTTGVFVLAECMVAMNDETNTKRHSIILCIFSFRRDLS